MSAAHRCEICGGVCERHVCHGVYVYYRCSECFTSQVQPQPCAEELSEYYRTYHLKGGETDGQYVFGERTRADFPAKVSYIKRAIRWNGTKLRLLDVGCGKGWFLCEAMRSGFDVQGVDYGEAAIGFASGELGLDVRHGCLERIMDSTWEERFDIVTLWATIEHLSDPKATLAAVFRCLKRGGHLFLDTGLGNAWIEHFLPGHTQWFDAPQHLWVFSIKGLGLLLRQAGFQVCHTNRNWERSSVRRIVKAIRFNALCLSSYAMLRIPLGTRGFRKTKESTWWPVGTLVSVVARKPE